MRAPVIIPHDHDVEILDNDVLDWDCPHCGTSLDLPHLVDYDREYIWFGGCCGKCGAYHDVDGQWFDSQDEGQEEAGE